MAGLVYVEAVPGIEALRIGRTIDLSQRLLSFEYRYFPVEVVLVGHCIGWGKAPEYAEARIFRLLDEIHLSRHNPLLYGQLPTYDWYLPDRNRILRAFLGLCRGEFPLFTGIERAPLFERFTKAYPAYSTPDEIRFLA